MTHGNPIPILHSKQRDQSPQSSGALHRARNKVKGYISLSCKDKCSNGDTFWPVRKNDAFTNPYMVSALCIYLGTLTSTAV